jgi:hypothetical protein
VTSSFEAAQPFTGLELAGIPQAVLAAVIRYFEANAVDLPDRRYVTAGDPNLVAWDCSQLVVCLTDLGWGRAADATQLSPSFGKAASINAMRHATYSVLLTREVPTIEDGGELPAAADLNTSGLDVMRDAGILSQALVNFVTWRDPSLPVGGSAQAGAVQMIGPAGGLVGCSGALIVTAAELAQPSDQLPPGFAITNGSPGGGL